MSTMPADARIIDRGYRPYDGPRLGAAGAVRSLVRHTAQRVMGLKRPFQYKILPLLSAGIAYVPAIVFVGLSALIKDDRVRQGFLPTYGQYYGFIVSALIVFASFVAPEALCPDRRTGMLGLYLAAPFTRASYVASKVGSVLALLAIATLGPPLLMVIAFVLQSQGPDGPLGVLTLLARVVLSGAMVAAVYTAVSLGISSLTDRRAIASAATLLTIVGTGAVTGVLVEGVGMGEWLYMFNLSSAPFELVRRIFGEHGEINIDLLPLVAGVAFWISLGTATIWWRYRRIEVTK
ncbi:MAG TPA: ABC transporter permease subunit [Acidimicrobiales bacterium]|nr:ABC transporter permease subunit [Acidimicrobiales bacterium]